MLFKRKKEPKVDNSKLGGIPFYISLIALSILSIANLIAIPLVLKETPVVRIIFFYSAPLLLGYITAMRLLPRRFGIFVHELKHLIISTLAGNKSKELVVGKDDGHYLYEFSKDTKVYNAFISTAPYWFPLWSIVGLAIIFFTVSANDFNTAAVILGLAMGVDVYQNNVDLHPAQSDFTRLRGGYKLGFIYVFAMNFAIVSLLFVYAMRGVAGWGDMARIYVSVVKAVLGASHNPLI